MNFRINVCALALVALGAVGCSKSETRDQAGNELSLVDPSDKSLKPGEEVSLSVQYDGRDIEGPLAIRIADLPRGVSVLNPNEPLPGRSGRVEFRLLAAADAPPVKDHPAMVTISAGSRAASQMFDVSVARLE
jgi:hypothetical protein